MDSKQKNIFQQLSEIFNISAEDRKAANDVISEIKKIKKQGDKYSIDKAEKAYKSLTKKQARLVPGDLLDFLFKAKDHNDLQYVKETINDLKDITKKNTPLELIILAKRAYNQLSTRLKLRVPKELIKLLNTAEDEYDRFKADEMIKKIENIGPVQNTSDYEDTINSARNAYFSLSEKQRELVTNLNKLTEVEKGYDKLVVGNVSKKLREIDKYDSYSSEPNGLDCYNKLSKRQKELVDENLLNTVKQKYEQINKQEERNRVSRLIKSIKDIDFSDPEWRAGIKSTRDAYNQLSEEQKEGISPEEIQTLNDAERIYATYITKKIMDQENSKNKKEEDFGEDFIKKYKIARNWYKGSNDYIKKYIKKDALESLENNKTDYDKLVAGSIESRINNVGDVERSDKFEDTLSEIQRDYDKLDETQKQFISQKTMKQFEEIKTKYDQLVAEGIKSYMEKIKNIEITDIFGKTLSEASKYFSSFIGNKFISDETLQSLNDAKSQLEITKKDYENQKEAANVMKMINSIKLPVTRDKISEIENVEEAYKNYTNKLVLNNCTNNLVSSDCQKKLNEAKKAVKLIKDVDNVKSEIDSAYEITNKFDDIKYIELIYEARKNYEKLNENQKREINNYKKLLAAEKNYSCLATKNVYDKIRNIDLVSLTHESRFKILDARRAFDKLSDNEKKNMDDLEEELLGYETEYNELATKHAISLINSIGKVQLSDKFKSQIDEAREAFNSLSSEMQKQVKNLNVLEKAETSLKEEEEEYKNALAKTKKPLKNIDKFYKESSSKFDESFYEQLKEGFDLCIKTDEGLKNYENKNLIDNLDKNGIKDLKKLIEEKSLHPITINYLYFMIDQIKVKKYYSEFKNDEKPQIINDNTFDIDRKENISEKDVEDAINKFRGSEKKNLNSLFSEVKKVIDLKPEGADMLSLMFHKKNCDTEILKLLRLLLVSSQIKFCDNEKWGNLPIRQQFRELTKIENALPSENGDQELELAVKTILQYMKKNVGNVVDFEKPTTPLFNIENDKLNITKDDVHQGKNGTCWLLSTLLSIIKSDPELILNCFPKYKDEIDLKTGNIKSETITVRLWRVLLSGHEKNTGLRLYARTFGKYVDVEMNATVTKEDYGNKAKVCWPRFLEKAISIARTIKNLVIVDDSSGKNFLLDVILDYGKEEWNQLNLHWDSNSGDYGGGIAQAMITGHTSGLFANVNVNSKFSNYHDIQESYFEYIKSHLTKRHKITASCKENFKPTNSDLVVVGHHAWSLIKAYEDNGKQKIKILNPYNDSSLSSQGLEGQEVDITIQEFIEHFQSIDIGGVSKF